MQKLLFATPAIKGTRLHGILASRALRTAFPHRVLFPLQDQLTDRLQCS